MATLPFGEYRPDLSDLNAAYTKNILNAIPTGDGYGPFQDFQVFTAALPGPCRGAFFARGITSGEISIFAGTSTDLYLLDNTTFTFALVSKSGGYSALDPDATWQFEQFNNIVLATQANDVLQAYNLTSDTVFSDNPGSPPQAAYIAIINGFVVLSGLLGFPLRIQWCGLNDLTNWSPGIQESDLQDFKDGGSVKGVTGGEFGYVMQESAVRRMVFVPNSDELFDISKTQQDVGAIYSGGIVNVGGDVFFLAAKGFQKIDSTGALTPIGEERINKTFLAEFDASQPQFLFGVGDPKSSLIFWAYKTIQNNTMSFDKLLVYNNTLDKFAPIEMTGEFLAPFSKPGITLEGLDSISASLDALPFSLDAVQAATFAQMAAFNASHQLGFFTGSNLEAILETAEQTGMRQRMRINGFNPVTDASSVFGSTAKRENLNAVPVYTAEASMNAQGICPQRADTRHARGRIRIPAGTDWKFATGLDPDVQQSGAR